MDIYLDIVRLADEMGQSPDFVITWGARIALLLGFVMGVVFSALLMKFHH